MLNADWEHMMTFCSFPKELWQHIRATNVVESPFESMRLRTDAAKRFNEVGERHNGHLEDDGGRRKAIPKMERTRIVTRGILGCGICQWRCHRKRDGGCRLRFIYTPVDETSHVILFDEMVFFPTGNDLNAAD
jgi:uncharacterized Fe-S radical SAM superfamily protein PflX